MKKLNWGHKIAITYLVFVAGIMYLVVKASNENFDLVEKDYYAAELRYQEIIDEAEKTKALSAPITIEKQDARLRILFPGEFSGKTIEGEFLLYYPANAKRDVKENFRVRNNFFEIHVPPMNKGLHRVKMRWTVDGERYYHEQTIFL